jgi:hypothetical protein
MLAVGIGTLALLRNFAAGAGDAAAAALDEVVVTSARETVVAARATSASEGTVTAELLDTRPLLRPAEVLEAVPGLVVTQHSGDGKANQYFLRGFNLDHGTDFATWVDGAPVNMPTHAHGQGYSDLNFLIPELVERIDYRKGVYDAEDGDFSAAGTADIHYRRRLDAPFASLTAGQEGYRRIVAGFSAPLAAGELLVGGDYGVTDGPWILPEHHQRTSALVKYARGDPQRGWTLTGMAYQAHWRATDQIPLRAVSAGVISRFGNIDPTDGGTSHRWSLSGEAWSVLGEGEWRARGYLLDYRLDLFSNFTYYTDQEHGDQIEQYDNRRVYGGHLAYSGPLRLFGASGTLRAGVQLRDDHIDPVGLYDTTARIRWKSVSVDEAHVRSASAYVSWDWQPASWWRAGLGARIDSYHFDVTATLPANSGQARAALASPKLSLVFGPWARSEYFLDFGQGFHSNDARGTVIHVDPNDGVTPVSRVTPLARATGAEAGARTTPIPQLQLTLALWTLKLDSELTLDNDASAIVPSAATRRYGVEGTVAWRARPGVRVDLDLAWTHARYVDPDPYGQYLPNAPVAVAALGIEVGRPLGWFGGAHARYFGQTPLTQDGEVRSRASLQVNGEVGYRWSSVWCASLGVFNLLDRHDYDVEYYYASQLRREAAPVNDLHVHPFEPRTWRATLSWRF